MSNLYGWAMSGYLPYGGFKWLKNVDNFDVNSISKESLIGYILEVDLKILMNYVYCTMIIHSLQKNFQLLMICCQIIIKKLLTSSGTKVGDVKKLILNLGNKTNYMFHYRSL